MALARSCSSRLAASAGSPRLTPLNALLNAAGTTSPPSGGLPAPPSRAARSSAFTASQVRCTSRLVSALASPKTCGCRRTIFCARRSCTSVRSNAPRSAASCAWRITCSSTSPSSSAIAASAAAFGCAACASIASCSSQASSMRCFASVRCVCSRSHGQPSGARRRALIHGMAHGDARAASGANGGMSSALHDVPALSCSAPSVLRSPAGRSVTSCSVPYSLVNSGTPAPERPAIAADSAPPRVRMSGRRRSTAAPASAFSGTIVTPRSRSTFGAAIRAAAISASSESSPLSAVTAPATPLPPEPPPRRWRSSPPSDTRRARWQSRSTRPCGAVPLCTACSRWR